MFKQHWTDNILWHHFLNSPVKFKYTESPKKPTSAVGLNALFYTWHITFAQREWTEFLNEQNKQGETSLWSLPLLSPLSVGRIKRKNLQKIKYNSTRSSQNRFHHTQSHCVQHVYVLPILKNRVIYYERASKIQMIK